MSLTRDANVFVAALRAHEINHAASLEFLRAVEQQGLTVSCPSLILAECSAAIIRQTGRSDLAQAMLDFIEGFQNFFLVSLDIPLARQAAEIAIAHRLRGADSIYVAVAEALSATLITWDDEMLQCSPVAVATMTPIQWVAKQPLP